jgi:hypothetical protein
MCHEGSRQLPSVGSSLARNCMCFPWAHGAKNDGLLMRLTRDDILHLRGTSTPASEHRNRGQRQDECCWFWSR